jgi:hypothetical protein
MSQFWELFKSSVITQSVITIIVVATYCYLLISGRATSPDLWTLVSILIGFYFGSKVGYTQGTNAAAAKKG